MNTIYVVYEIDTSSQYNNSIELLKEGGIERISISSISPCWLCFDSKPWNQLIPDCVCSSKDFCGQLWHWFCPLVTKIFVHWHWSKIFCLVIFPWSANQMNLSYTVAWSTCNHVPIEIHNFKSRERDREIVFPKQKPDLDPFIPMHCRPRSGGNRPLLGNRGEKKSGTQIHQQVNIVIVDVKDLSFTWACNKKQIGQKKLF